MEEYWNNGVESLSDRIFEGEGKDTCSTTILKRNSIVHRGNTPYYPEENGKIERFHGTLNQRSIQYYWYPSDTLETLEYELQSFLKYYNFKKRYRGLGMHGLTPYKKLSLLAFRLDLFSSQNVNLTLQYNMI